MIFANFYINGGVFMDSLGYFGKWFPTEHKKYTAFIVMMYVGIVATVLGTLLELLLKALGMAGIFGMPAGLRRTVSVLNFFSTIDSLVTLALFVIIIYLLYKTRALVYLLKMWLGYFVVSLLLGLITFIFNSTVAAVLFIIGIIATIYVNRKRWHYISRYRRYIYYVLGSWAVCLLGTLMVVGYIISSISRIFFGMAGGGYGTLVGYAVLILFLWLLPTFCQHYIYRREEAKGTSFYQAFRLLNTVPLTALFFIFGISSLANIGTLSGENMFTSFDFDYDGDNHADFQNSNYGISTQNVNQVNNFSQPDAAPAGDLRCPQCGQPVAASDAFCSHCGTALHRCPHCGHFVEKDAKFCPACGTPLNKAQDAAAVSQTMQSAAPAASVQEILPAEPSQRPSLLQQFEAHKKAVIAAAVVVILAIAGGFWYGHSQSQKKALPQGTGSAAAAQKTADSELSLNGVYLGESWAEAKEGLGRELGTSNGKDGSLHHKFTDMEVVVKDDKVVTLVSSSEAAQTKRGLHQGSSLDDVINAYGDDYQASEYGAQTHYEYAFKTDDGQDALLRFAVSKNSKTVEYISVRVVDSKAEGAKKAFLAYHKAISDHQLQTAYGLLTPAFQNSVGGYDGYAPGYDNTISSQVSNLRQIAAGADKTTFSFSLKARDKIPGSTKVKVQTFNGQVTMVKDGSDWKIGEMSAKKTGEHVE